MKAMVIGANNFIGSHLIRYLRDIQKQETVSVAVSSVGELVPERGCISVDFSRPNEVHGLFEAYQPECLYCLLAVDSISYAWQYPAEVVQIHINYMLNILEAVKKYQPHIPVVIIGSGEEYGHVGFDHLPIRETQKPMPQNAYAVTKTCQTMMARLYYNAYHMRIIVARIFNAVGPGQSKRFVIPDFCLQAARFEAGLQECVIRTGNLNIRRDFVDVRDVVRALCLLSEKGRPGEIYNVGSETAYSIREVLDIILTQVSTTPRIERAPEKIRPIDVPVLQADCSKCHTETGWTCEFALEDTISDILLEARECVAKELLSPTPPR